MKTKKELQERGLVQYNEVNLLKITSQDKYLVMVELFKEATAFCESVDAFFEDMRVKTYAAYQQVLSDKRKSRKPYEDAAKLAKQRMKGWEELEAEKTRQAEAKREAARIAAEDAAKAAKKAGEAPPPAPVIPRARVNRARQAEIIYVDNWKANQVDMVKLVKAAAKDPALLKYLEPCRTELNKFAKRTAGDVEVPGVTWINDKTVKR